jgi:WD40 repeat protein
MVKLPRLSQAATLLIAGSLLAVCFSTSARMQDESTISSLPQITVENAGQVRHIVNLDFDAVSISRNYDLIDITTDRNGEFIAGNFQSHDPESFKPFVQIWDVNSLSPKYKLQHENSVRNMIFSSDGNLLATVDSEGKVRLWSLDTGEVLCQWDGGKLLGRTIAFSPDGNYFAFSGDLSVVIWNLESDTEHIVLNQPYAFTIVFSPTEEKLAVISLDTNFILSLWDFSDIQQPISDVISNGASVLNDLMFTSSGLQFIYDAFDEEGSTLRIWNVAEHKEERVLNSSFPCYRGITSRNYGNVFCYGEDRTSTLFEISTGINLTSSREILVAINPDETIYATTNDADTAFLHDVQTGEVLVELNDPSVNLNTAFPLRFSADGRYIITLAGNGVSLWGVTEDE